MKDYKFLVKPSLFIFNLLFATWLVLKIEQIKPSDFGSGQFMQQHIGPNASDKALLRNLLRNFKTGKMDSLHVDQEIDHVLMKLKGSSGN
jgi:hypothetical protein